MCVCVCNHTSLPREQHVRAFRLRVERPGAAGNTLGNTRNNPLSRPLFLVFTSLRRIQSNQLANFGEATAAMATRMRPVGEPLALQQSRLPSRVANVHNPRHPQLHVDSTVNRASLPGRDHPTSQLHPHQHPLPLPLPYPSSPHRSATVAPTDRRAQSRMNKPSLEPVLEGDNRLLRDVKTPPPGDVTRMRRKASHPEVSRQRSIYFEDAFASGDRNYAGDDIRNEAIILVEVKTNVIVNCSLPDAREAPSNNYLRSTTSSVSSPSYALISRRGTTALSSPS